MWLKKPEKSALGGKSGESGVIGAGGREGCKEQGVEMPTEWSAGKTSTW